MTQHIKGKVEAIKKGEVKTVKADGTPYKNAWYPTFMKISGLVYKLGHTTDEFGPHVKEGDEVEFDFIEKQSPDTGDTIREILNDWKDESKKTFKNITNPAKPFGGNKGGGYKKDPEEQARIVAMASINAAIAWLDKSENSSESTLFTLAEKIEKHVYGISIRLKTHNFQNNKLNVNSDPGSPATFQEDEIPF